MARSARPLDDEDEDWESPLASAAAAGLGLVARNPVMVGGLTAFLVAMSFVSANALWYQPHPHAGAFFATRDYAGPLPGAVETGTTIRIVRPRPAPERPKGDPQVERVQAVLKEIGFYGGDVDGLAGPATRKAIEDYQSKMGLAVTGKIDAPLLEQLDAAPTTAAIVPIPAPRQVAAEPASDAPVPASNAGASASEAAIPASAGSDRQIMKIQAGLRAFGNEDIEIDGVLGARTRAAIHEFQALFGLPETGEPDAAVYAKMREIGLAD